MIITLYSNNQITMNKTKKSHFNNNRINIILFLIKLLKLIGFGRGILKKILFKIIKRFIGTKGVYYIYNSKLFKLFPLKNSTDSKMIISSKIIDYHELNALKNINKTSGSTFFDIGANIGYYSISCSNYGFEKIFSFEPIPRVIEQLKTNIQLNELEDLIQVIPKGLGEKNEVKEINEDLTNFGNSSFTNKILKKITHKIEVINLKDFIKERGIVTLDAIKIDVEGYEDRVLYQFLESLREDKLPKILIIEFSNSNLWEKDLFKLLKSKSYKKKLKTRGNIIFIR